MCIGLVSAAHAQNLVPDPGFEQYMFGCAQGLQLEDLTHWDRLIGAQSPIYYNACNGLNGFPEYSVPTNLNGVENAHGNGYCGMMTYSLGWLGNPREYLNTLLSAPLEAGVEYCFQAWVSRADTAHCATGTLQGWLVTGNAPNLFVEPDDEWFGTAPITVATVQVGSVGWTLLETTFTATGSENNLTIGSFAHGEQIDTVNIINDYPYNAYYYIDDVYLGSCDGIGLQERTGQRFELDLYPNPVFLEGEVRYTLDGAMDQSCTLSVFDLAGKCVRPPVKANSKGTLSLVGLAKGTYVVIANSQDIRSRKLLGIQ